jgi:hypothetical protein
LPVNMPIDRPIAMSTVSGDRQLSGERKHDDDRPQADRGDNETDEKNHVGRPEHRHGRKTGSSGWRSQRWRSCSRPGPGRPPTREDARGLRQGKAPAGDPQSTRHLRSSVARGRGS